MNLSKALATVTVAPSLELLGDLARAQPEQTSESANAFLHTLVKTYPIGCVALLSTGGTAQCFGTGRVPAFVLGDGRTGRKCVSYLTDNPDLNREGFVTVDWARVMQLRVNGREITWRENEHWANKLTFPSDDLATRAGFAMEFLRRGCDPTAGLAF